MERIWNSQAWGLLCAVQLAACTAYSQSPTLPATVDGGAPVAEIEETVSSPVPDAETTGISPNVNCEAAIPDSVLVLGHRAVAHRMERKGDDKEASRWGVTGYYPTDEDFLVVAFGPDGRSLGGNPPPIPESTRILVLAYLPRDQVGKYDIQVDGCDVPILRSRGTLKEVALPAGEKEAATEFQLSVVLEEVGRCSADRDVTIRLTAVKSICGDAVTGSVGLRTKPVYHFTAGVGVLFNNGKPSSVGIDGGIGGQPDEIFERRDTTGVVGRAVIGAYPFGFAPGFGYEHPLDRILLATAIDLTDPLSSFNLSIGYEVIDGLDIVVGTEFCRREKVLRDRVSAGDIFDGSESELPTRARWDCNPSLLFGVTANLEVVRLLLGGN